MKPLPNADPDVLLAVEGTYVNAASLPLAARTRCRVIRVVQLTPREQNELLHRIGELTGDLLVGLVTKRGGGR